MQFQIDPRAQIGQLVLEKEALRQEALVLESWLNKLCEANPANRALLEQIQQGVEVLPPAEKELGGVIHLIPEGNAGEEPEGVAVGARAEGEPLPRMGNGRGRR